MKSGQAMRWRVRTCVRKARGRLSLAAAGWLILLALVALGALVA